MLNTTNTEGGSHDLGATLSERTNEGTNIEKLIQEFQESLEAACTKSSRQRTMKKVTTIKSVPWWTDELTVLRTRTNALRRRYQRTRKNAGLSEQRQTVYLAEKTRYEATIKREKIRSWKEYCNLTSSYNPWNEVYKLVTGKRRNNTQIKILRKPDGSLSEHFRETLQLMLQYFTPVDKEEYNTGHHKLARAQTFVPADAEEDEDFNVEETREAVASMNKRKAPGEFGITGEVIKSTFDYIPQYIPALYNGCLRKGVFPKRWKVAKHIPIVKPGKEKSNEV